MTAINVRVSEDAVEIVTDGLYVAPGRHFTGAKVLHLPQAKAVFAMRGLGSLLPVLFMAFSELGRSFDDLVAGASHVLRQIVEAHGSALPVEASRLDIVLAGVSDERGPEAWLVSTYAPNGTPAGAFELQPIEVGSVTPFVDLDGLDQDAADFLMQVGKRQVLAYPGGVGGFLQRTIVDLAGIRSSVVLIDAA